VSRGFPPSPRCSLAPARSAWLAGSCPRSVPRCPRLWVPCVPGLCPRFGARPPLSQPRAAGRVDGSADGRMSCYGVGPVVVPPGIKWVRIEYSLGRVRGGYSSRARRWWERGAPGSGLAFRRLGSAHPSGPRAPRGKVPSPTRSVVHALAGSASKPYRSTRRRSPGTPSLGRRSSPHSWPVVIPVSGPRWTTQTTQTMRTQERARLGCRV
jgi:hypothetical protein